MHSIYLITIILAHTVSTCPIICIMIFIYNVQLAHSYTVKDITASIFPKNKILITREKISKCAFQQSTATCILNNKTWNLVLLCRKLTATIEHFRNSSTEQTTVKLRSQCTLFITDYKKGPAPQASRKAQNQCYRVLCISLPTYITILPTVCRFNDDSEVGEPHSKFTTF